MGCTRILPDVGWLKATVKIGAMEGWRKMTHDRECGGYMMKGEGKMG